MEEGFVAYFDILGFSQQMNREEDFTEKFEKYSRILADACEPRNIDYLSFSDSVVLSSKGSELPELLSIGQAVAGIQYNLLIELNSPICGAISFGNFNRVVKEGNGMITGRPLLEAIDF